MRAALPQGPVLVQVPRAGYLVALVCQDCREPARCAFCDGPLHATSSRPTALSCGWCGRPQGEWRCPICDGRRVRAPVVGADPDGRGARPCLSADTGPSLVRRPGPRRGAGSARRSWSPRPGAEPPADGGYAGGGPAGHPAAAAETGPAGRRGGAASLAERDRAGPAGRRRRLGAGGGGVVRPGAAGAGPGRRGRVRGARARRPVRGALSAGRDLVSVEGPPDAVAELLGLVDLPDAAEALGPVELAPGVPTGERRGPHRLLLRAPRSQRAALVRAVKGALGVRSARKSEGGAALSRSTRWRSRVSPIRVGRTRRPDRRRSTGSGLYTPAVRIVFAGTPEVAVPSLEALLASRHEVVGVLTRPDAPSGRGRTLQPESGRRSSRPSAASRCSSRRRSATRSSWPGSASWRRTAARSWPTARCYRRSRSTSRPAAGSTCTSRVLPRWRGAAPVQHAVLAGDQRHGSDDVPDRARSSTRARCSRRMPSRSARPTRRATCSAGWRSAAPSCWSTPWTGSRPAGSSRSRSRRTASRIAPKITVEDADDRLVPASRRARPADPRHVRRRPGPGRPSAVSGSRSTPPCRPAATTWRPASVEVTKRALRVGHGRRIAVLGEVRPRARSRWPPPTGRVASPGPRTTASRMTA